MRPNTPPKQPAANQRQPLVFACASLSAAASASCISDWSSSPISACCAIISIGALNIKIAIKKATTVFKSVFSFI